MTLVLAPVMGTLSFWHIDDGARVEKGETVAEIELMKTLNAVSAPKSGVLRYRIELGEIVNEGEAIATIEDQ